MADDITIGARHIKVGVGLVVSLMLGGLTIAISFSYRMNNNLLVLTLKQEAGNSRLDETVSTLKEISGKVDGQNDRLFLIQERQAGFAERIAALEEWRRRSGG